MATITPVSSRPDKKAEQVLWETLTELDTAASFKARGRRCSVQVVGTFATATVIMEGSNDGTNWFALNDVDGSAISMTADGGAEFYTSARYVRPSASGGGASQDVDIYAIFR